MNYLVSKDSKTKEIVFDQRNVSDHEPVVIKDQVIQQLLPDKYLGICIGSLPAGQHILTPCALDSSCRDYISLKDRGCILFFVWNMRERV